VSSSALFGAEQIYAGFAQMKLQQEMQRLTGATHASGWLRADGRVEIVREDVGRHNSLDKLIGALIRTGQDLSSGAALITSRASYEMVQKAATVGIGFLAAISAPTGLAVRLAEQTQLTLLGFVRQQSHVVYTQPQRIRRETINRGSQMDIRNLVTMANQIGAFFEAMPDRTQAMQDIAAHIKRNWDPRMRRAMMQYLDEQGGDDLKEIVREALRAHRDGVV
jgi:hypothetical protein